MVGEPVSAAEKLARLYHFTRQEARALSEVGARRGHTDLSVLPSAYRKLCALAGEVAKDGK